MVIAAWLTGSPRNASASRVILCIRRLENSSGESSLSRSLILSRCPSRTDPPGVDANQPGPTADSPIACGSINAEKRQTAQLLAGP